MFCGKSPEDPWDTVTPQLRVEMLKRVLAKVLNVGLNPLSGDDLASGNHIVSVEEREVEAHRERIALPQDSPSVLLPGQKTVAMLYKIESSFLFA